MTETLKIKPDGSATFPYLKDKEGNRRFYGVKSSDDFSKIPTVTARYKDLVYRGLLDPLTVLQFTQDEINGIRKILGKESFKTRAEKGLTDSENNAASLAYNRLCDIVG